MANYVNQGYRASTNVVIQMGYGVPTSTVKPGSMAVSLLIEGSTASSMTRQQLSCLRTDEGYLRRMASANDYFDMGSIFNILMRKLV